MKFVTIETRVFDASGELLDVQTNETIAEAKAFVPAVLDGGAWVIEKRTVYEKTGAPDSYRTIATGGSPEALRAAGF
jgi:hypothetical protein